ncbi:hypothetical protein MTR_6g033305 [Medicago truncatula]|uniref:Uncharacterized protein n=1 Tax=Medicago truncatula TaxID=3880 RepID=A0A072U7B0_MEDTR|nr:hypothetical protein MTR_6g033305 [Medicago truncatula]
MIRDGNSDTGEIQNGLVRNRRDPKRQIHSDETVTRESVGERTTKEGRCLHLLDGIVSIERIHRAEVEGIRQSSFKSNAIKWFSFTYVTSDTSTDRYMAAAVTTQREIGF